MGFAKNVPPKVEYKESVITERGRLTDEQRQAVTEGRLGPDQSSLVSLLGRAVDEAPSDPGCPHGEDTNEHADITASQHHLIELKIIFSPPHPLLKFPPVPGSAQFSGSSSWPRYRQPGRQRRR